MPLQGGAAAATASQAVKINWAMDPMRDMRRNPAFPR